MNLINYSNQMKKLNPFFVISIFVMVIFLTSCSTNQFAARRNHQPRVKVEAMSSVNQTELVKINDHGVVQKDSAQPQVVVVKDLNNKPALKPKNTIMETMIEILFPKKKELFKQLLKPGKLPKANKVKKTGMDGNEITGLVISLLALALSITSIFMIIGMAGGNVWVYFVVGMILALIGMTIGFIAKKVLPWRGFSIAAVAVAILSIVLLLIFLILITVFSIVF